MGEGGKGVSPGKVSEKMDGERAEIGCRGIPE